jgi:hypothetical protein
MCMEPTSFTVKEDSQFKGGDTDFVATKLMTRLTYTLDEVSSVIWLCWAGGFYSWEVGLGHGSWVPRRHTKSMPRVWAAAAAACPPPPPAQQPLAKQVAACRCFGDIVPSRCLCCPYVFVACR